MGANLDNTALPGVYFAVVMGRHAGFLTAASALARKYPDDGPHLIYLPERTFVVDKFLADVKAASTRSTAAASSPSPKASTTRTARRSSPSSPARCEKDAHGNVQLSGTGALADLLCEEVKNKLGIKRVRGDTFGYLQRSFVGCVSDVDQREAREVGEKAVQYAMWGDKNGSVAIRRVADYAVDYPLIPLETVAGKTRVMEDEFIAPAGNDVTRRSSTICVRCSARDMPEVVAAARRQGRQGPVGAAARRAQKIASSRAKNQRARGATRRWRCRSGRSPRP